MSETKLIIHEDVIKLFGGVNEQSTTPIFWDCECEKDFMHPRTVLGCDKCGKERWDQPDSRIVEVVKFIFNNTKVVI